MTDAIRVLIVDDHVLVRSGIHMLLDTDPSVQIVGEAGSGRDAVWKTKTLQPDVILMDLLMPDGDGIQAIAEIKDCNPNAKILVLTTFGDESRAKAAMQAGADGYLLKEADGEALLGAIHAVLRGEMPIHPSVAPHLIAHNTDGQRTGRIRHLTEREKEVLQLVAQGWSNRAIAAVLNLSAGTVKIHVSNILSKLDVSSRTEASVLALQSGLILPVNDVQNGHSPERSGEPGRKA